MDFEMVYVVTFKDYDLNRAFWTGVEALDYANSQFSDDRLQLIKIEENMWKLVKQCGYNVETVATVTEYVLPKKKNIAETIKNYRFT